MGDADELEVLGDREVVVEQRRVGDERERGAGALRVGLGVRVGAGRRAPRPPSGQQARDGAHGRRLARAVRPDERQALAGAQLEVEALERGQAPVAVREPLRPSTGAGAPRGSAGTAPAAGRAARLPLLEGGHRQPRVAQLLPVVLGRLLLAAPHERLAGVVDRVRVGVAGVERDARG